MTLRTRVARLDDYTEELTRELEKLEMEKAGGVINKDEQVDFIRELRLAIDLKDIKPWRSRATTFGLVGLLLLVAAFFLPTMVPHRQMVQLLTGLVALLSLLYAIFAFSVSYRRSKSEMRWLDQLEETVNKGGTIFD